MNRAGPAPLQSQRRRGPGLDYNGHGESVDPPGSRDQTFRANLREREQTNQAVERCLHPVLSKQSTNGSGGR